MGSQIFQVVISIRSVFFKNTLQIFGVIAFNIMALIYSVFQCYQIENAKKLFGANNFNVENDRIFTLVGIVSGTITLGQILLLIFGFRLYKEFGWMLQSSIRFSLEFSYVAYACLLSGYFMTYHLLLMFLKFDLFFFFGFILQFLLFTIKEQDPELWITLIFIPVSLLVGFLSIAAVQKENPPLTVASLFGLLMGVVYFLFKIFRLLTVSKYANFKNFLSLFAFLSLFVIAASAALLVSCYRNFNKGLGPYIQLSLHSYKNKAVRPHSLNLEGE
ncbi:hypothetical protein L0F63_000264 [Massospora cicadina]|nr:hypothetical protein L0F63_000264 [Massospora cicadina]